MDSEKYLHKVYVDGNIKYKTSNKYLAYYNMSKAKFLYKDRKVYASTEVDKEKINEKVKCK